MVHLAKPKDPYRKPLSGEESPAISATQVRDALLEKRTLDGLVDPSLHSSVRDLFEVAMARLKKM